MSTPATFMRLLDAVSDHLHTFPLPAGIFSIKVEHTHSRDERAIVHLVVTGLPAVASALLTWVGTLTDTRVEVWRVPSGDSVHVTLYGLLSCGLAVEVFSGVGFTAGDFDYMYPGDRDTVPLAMVAEWAARGEGGAAA